MAQPRRQSRPDRPAVDSHQGARLARRSSPAGTESAAPSAHDDSHGIDPGRLIEIAFRDRCPADEPETYVLAWLAVLRAPVDAPCAAAILAERLRRLPICVRSPWQRRLIELLDFVARHRRRKHGDALRSINSPARKGTP
jgi:hypothetical protein